ncbi:MAG TPA: SDR family oxidoreductase [Acidimicrobiales bacterium]|nr:SDR family oxidoreductase [Acidimicrobiales bacterium]
MTALDGWSVLVTGGGTGIGRACAARLAADGAMVTICGRTQSRLEAAAAGIPRAQWVVADVTVEDQVVVAVERAAAAGPLRGVVANAGGGGGMAPYHLQDVQEFRRVLELNVIGTMLTLKHTVRHLVAAGGGSFVGMSSIAGSVTHPVFGAYPVGKAGIEHMMRNAADDYGAAGVRCNAVAPGFTETEIMEGIPRDSSVFESYLRNIPMGEVAQPADVAEAVRFLIGPESRFVTGTVVYVDGGHHLRAGPDFRPFTGLGPDQLLARG